jgi:hypothetical protein
MRKLIPSRPPRQPLPAGPQPDRNPGNPCVHRLGSPVAAFVVSTARGNGGMNALIIHSCGTVMHVPSGGSDGFVEAQETEFRSWGFSQVSIQHPQVISAWASLRPSDLRRLPHIHSGDAALLVQALRDGLSLPRIDTMEDHARARPVYGRLIVVSGPGTGDVHPVFEFNSIGRGPHCDIALRFATGGRHIATLLFDTDKKRFFLSPQSAQVLTVVNGEVLLSLREIAAGESVTIGGIGVRIESASSPSPSATSFEPGECKE